MDIDFTAPFYKVSIGGQEAKVNKFDIWSIRDNPTDVCTVEVIKDTSYGEDMPIEIMLGYRDEWLWKVFSGYVYDVRPQVSTTILEAKDEMLKLIRTKIKQAFVNALPQEVIRFGLKAAGVTRYELTNTIFPRKTLNAPNISVKELVEAVNRTWGTHFPFYFDPEKTFHWKEAEASGNDIPVFEYRKNIVDLEPFGETIRLTTFLAPFIGHSQQIKVLHPNLKKQLYTVSKVRWFTNEKGFPRTQIYMEAVK